MLLNSEIYKLSTPSIFADPIFITSHNRVVLRDNQLILTIDPYYLSILISAVCVALSRYSALFG